MSEPQAKIQMSCPVGIGARRSRARPEKSASVSRVVPGGQPGSGISRCTRATRSGVKLIDRWTGMVGRSSGGNPLRRTTARLGERRRPCHPRAFSREVGTGSRQKMRPNQESGASFRFNVEETRSRVRSSQADAARDMNRPLLVESRARFKGSDRFNPIRSCSAARAPPLRCPHGRDAAVARPSAGRPPHPAPSERSGRDASRFAISSSIGSSILTT